MTGPAPGALRWGRWTPSLWRGRRLLVGGLITVCGLKASLARPPGPPPPSPPPHTQVGGLPAGSSRTWFPALRAQSQGAAAGAWAHLPEGLNRGRGCPALDRPCLARTGTSLPLLETSTPGGPTPIPPSQKHPAPTQNQLLRKSDLAPHLPSGPRLWFWSEGRLPGPAVGAGPHLLPGRRPCASRSPGLPPHPHPARSGLSELNWDTLGRGARLVCDLTDPAHTCHMAAWRVGTSGGTYASC